MKTIKAAKMTSNYFEIDKHGNLKKTSQSLKKKDKIKKDFGIANYFNIGYYLLTPIILGIIVGKVADNWLKTNFFLLIMLILGITGTFYNLWRIYKDAGNKH